MDQSNEKVSTLTSVFLGILLVFIVLFLIKKSEPIFIYSWYYLRLIQMIMLNLLPDWLPFVSEIPYKDGYRLLISTGPENYTVSVVKQFDHAFARFFSWIPALFIYMLFVRVSSKSDDVTKQYHTIEKILQKNATAFPFLKPYLNFNPATMKDLSYDHTDPVKMQYLPSVKVLEFGTMVPPVGLEEEAEHNKSYQLPIWDHENDYFDEDLAKRTFEKQLGGYYTTVSKMTEVEQEVYKVLLEKIEHDKKDIFKVVTTYCTYLAKNKGVFREGYDDLTPSRQKLIKYLEKLFDTLNKQNNLAHAKEKFRNKGYVRKIIFMENLYKLFDTIFVEDLMNRHAYVRTGLMSMLEAARMGGVIGCANFLPMKGKDRTLWYCIETLGRQVSFPECGGVFAHWQLEKMIGMPIEQPEVGAAVEALKLGLFVDKKSLHRKKKKQERMARLRGV